MLNNVIYLGCYLFAKIMLSIWETHNHISKPSESKVKKEKIKITPLSPIPLFPLLLKARFLKVIP